MIDESPTKEAMEAYREAMVLTGVTAEVHATLARSAHSRRRRIVRRVFMAIVVLDWVAVGAFLLAGR